MRDKRLIYLDHAATTAVRPEIVKVMEPFWTTNYGNASSFYQLGNDAAHVLQQAHEDVATCLSCDPREIFFTSCGSEANNWAIKGIAKAKQAKGKHIISTTVEHHAVLHSLTALEKEGFRITLVPVDKLGLVNPTDIQNAICDDTILVTVMMANNEIGTIMPIKEIAAICKAHGVIFHTDAVQACGAIPIDLKDLGVDMLSLSGHKIYAPKGVGALYVRKGVVLPNFIDGGAQERGHRAGTENVAGIVALATALKMAVADMPSEAKRQIELRDYLIKKIMERIPHTKLNGSLKHRLPNNVNFSFEFIEGESILIMLDQLGYCCSSGSACTSASLDPSHVLLAIGNPHEIAHGSLRVSIGRKTTKDELDQLIEDLPSIIARLREMSPLWGDFTSGRIEPLIPITNTIIEEKE